MSKVLLEIFHVIFGTIALAAGFSAVLGMFRGRLLQPATLIFMRSTLCASFTGLCSAPQHLRTLHWIAMYGVYATGVAVFALMRRELDGMWAAVFAVSIMLVFCLNLLALFVHIANVSHVDSSGGVYNLAGIGAILLLAVFSRFAVRRFSGPPPAFSSSNR